MASSRLVICATGHSLIYEWVKTKTCINVWVPWKNGWVRIHEWVETLWQNVKKWLSGWKKKYGRMSECPSYVWQGTRLLICMTWRRKIFSDASFFLLCFIRNTRKHYLNMNASFHDYEWVIFMFVTWCIQAKFVYIHETTHLWMIHLTYSNALRHGSEWVISHTLMCHVIYINESSFTKNKKCVHISAARHRYSGVISNTSMSHVIYENESCHVYQCAMSYVGMNHVTYIYESRHTYKCVMSHTSVRHVTCIDESFHIA